MASIGVFTIASKNYLPYVRVLMASLASVHPEYKRYLCLADRIDGYFDPAAEPYTVLEAEQLGIPDFSDFVLRYDIMEFNTAVKPFMFRWLFDHTDLDAVIYLDPDIQVFSRFDRLESLLNQGASAVLTPHITRPSEDGKKPNDYHFLQTGVFNLGFITVRRCSESLDFIDWWSRRLTYNCVVDLPSGLFVDQKWCDLAPCFLEQLKVLRDEGHNIAYWNLAQRRVSKAQNGHWQVDRSPLVFFHFSGVDPSDVQIVSKHQDRLSWQDIATAQPLFRAYNEALLQAGWKELRKWPYAYDELPGWNKINRVVRMVYRSNRPHQTGVPLERMGEYLKNICNEPCTEIRADDGVWISRLMFFIYRQRPDLQAVFLLETKQGRKDFADWFEQSGPREYDLPPELTRQKLISQAPQIILGDEKAATELHQTISATDQAFGEATGGLVSGLRKILNRFWLAFRILIKGY